MNCNRTIIETPNDMPPYIVKMKRHSSVFMHHLLNENIYFLRWLVKKHARMTFEKSTIVDRHSFEKDGSFASEMTRKDGTEEKRSWKRERHERLIWSINRASHEMIARRIAVCFHWMRMPDIVVVLFSIVSKPILTVRATESSFRCVVQPRLNARETINEMKEMRIDERTV